MNATKCSKASASCIISGHFWSITNPRGWVMERNNHEDFQTSPRLLPTRGPPRWNEGGADHSSESSLRPCPLPSLASQMKGGTLYAALVAVCLLAGGAQARCDVSSLQRDVVPRRARHACTEHLFLSPARQPRPSTLLSTDTRVLSRFSSMRSTSCMSLAVGRAKYQVLRKSPPAPRAHGSTCTCMTADVPHRLDCNAVVVQVQSDFGCTSYDSDSASFDIRYHSVNRDDVAVQFGWCATEDYSDCTFSNHCSSSTNLNQHCSYSSSNYKYKRNNPYIRLVCENFAQDCQIELTSASIAENHRRLGVLGLTSPARAAR